MQQTKKINKLLALSACTTVMLSVSGCGDPTYFSGSTNTAPPVSPAKTATLQKSIDDYFAAANPYFVAATGSEVPGAIVAIKMAGQQPFYYARGCAEIDLTKQVSGKTLAETGACKTPMTVDKQFHIASITKMFVAQTILEMEKENKWNNPATGKPFSVNDLVTDFIPGALKGINELNKKDITINNLLNHTSGLYTYITTDAGLGIGGNPNPKLLMNKYVMNKGKKFWANDLPTTEVLDFVNNFDPLTEKVTKTTNGVTEDVPTFRPYGINPYFPAGDGLHYSNTNYLLLGMIIEKITGTKVEEQIKRLITDPLKLSNTSLPTDSIKYNDQATYPNYPFNSSNFVHGYTDYYNKPITTETYTNAVDYAILGFHPYNGATVDPSAMYALPGYNNGDGLLEDFSHADLNFLWTTGGMVTNMKELLTFMENIVDTRVKTGSEKPYWKTMTSGIMGNSFEYSRGLVKIAGNWIGHSGQFAGYNVASYWLSAFDTHVIVMTNKYSYQEDDGTFMTLGLNDMGTKNTLYKTLLYPADTTTKPDPTVGIINSIIKTLANDPVNAQKLVGKSVDSLLLPNTLPIK